MEFWRRKKGKARRKCLLRNGGLFLEKLIADCNGISNPIRMFSSDQISEATNHFDPKCSFVKDVYFTCYKGDIEGRPYTVRVYIEDEEMACNDIVLSARVSNHSCFLKLIGCCLEFPLPVLVFEDLEALNIRGTVGCYDGPLLPWNARLKIAKEVATAITYLHTAFPRIIIHRDIKAMNVFLDKSGKAKLSNLSAAVTLPEGESWIKDKVVGTPVYVDPVYCMTNVVSEYTDVFSFGILMLVLLMGTPPFLEGSDLYWPNGQPNIFNWKFLEHLKDLHERGESVEFAGDSNDMRPDQMEMFLELALRCCQERSEDRPKMIMVAKAIKLIEQGSFDHEMLENGSNCFLKDGSLSQQQPIPDTNQISNATSHLDPKCYISEGKKEEETLRAKLKEFWRRKKDKGRARKCFVKNGSVFLEELIADCNGISNPIRMFSSDQISKATDHFDAKCSILVSFSCFPWYKGVIEGRPYAIKRYTEPVNKVEKMGYNDIVLSARVSNHSCFPKLIGCCLEFLHPVLVFEDLEFGALNVIGSIYEVDEPVLLWNVRLKIAKDVATAITYLHTAFPRIIIHRNINVTSVFLDKNGRAKLTDFSLAVTLPEGKSWIEDTVMGTIGYLDPVYLLEGLVTEYTDVYSFGVFMLVLLLGRPAALLGSDGNLDPYTHIVKYVTDLQERGEPVVFRGGSDDMNQMKMCLELALRCCNWVSRDQPKMIMVAKELKLIEKGSFDCSEMPENVSEDGQIKH